MNLPKIDWKLILAGVMALATGVQSVIRFETDQNRLIAENKNEIAVMKAEKATAVKFIAESEAASREYRDSLNNRLDRMEGNINLILKGAHK